MGKKKKKDAKKVVKKEYPTYVDERAKQAMALQPPDLNEFKQESEDNIEKFGRYRPKYFQDYENLKQKARLKNSN